MHPPHDAPGEALTPVALDDPQRLEAVRSLLREDGPLRGAFDLLVAVVAEALAVPVALLSLVDDERQSFVGCSGLPDDLDQTPLSHSFCQHVVIDAAPLVIRDAREDPRLRDNLAIPDLDVIAYAGIPVRAAGHVVGSLCAIDHRPRDWSAHELATLERLADLTTYLITARHRSTTFQDEQRDAIARHASRADEADAIVKLTGRLQRALLQHPTAVGPFTVDIAYRPGSRGLLVGGDFAATRLTGTGGIDFILGDVSGHGPEAAALGVELRAGWRALRATGADVPDVLLGLQHVVESTELTATVLLGNLTPDGALCVATAGHPPPLVVDDAGVRELALPPAPLLGLPTRAGPSWPVHEYELGDGRLLAYTDGLVEGRYGGGDERFGIDRLLALVAAEGTDPAMLLTRVSAANGGPLPDDVAMLLLSVTESAAAAPAA